MYAYILGEIYQYFYGSCFLKSNEKQLYWDVQELIYDAKLAQALSSLDDSVSRVVELNGKFIPAPGISNC